MARLLPGRKKRLVLDIGASAIRLCELSQTKAGYQLTKYYQQEFDSDPQLDEETRKNLKRKALAEIFKRAKVRSRKAVFGVPGQSVFTRTRALPPVPEYKVTQIVRYEIQQQIPFSLDQIAMDYQILDRTEAGGYDVMMAAIKVDVVEKHIDILQEAKRRIDVVDVCPMAAYNWVKHTGEFGDQGECVALIDIGAATTDIVIERDNQFRFTRPLNVGGNDITRAISAAFGLNFSDAERVKRERGFAPTGDPQRDGKGGEVIGKVLQRIVSEIMRSFAYFRSLPGGGQVNRVILCGGGACLRNIIPYLQQALGIEVRIAQPLAGLALAPAAQQVSDRPEQACVVLGLALRCCEAVPIEINLIPPRVLEQARQNEQLAYIGMIAVTIALIGASIIPVKANENKEVQRRINEVKQHIGRYDNEIKAKLAPGRSMPQSMFKQELQRKKKQIERLENDVAILDQVRTVRNFYLDEMTLVTEARPTTGGNIWLSCIESSRMWNDPDQASQYARGGQQGGGQLQEQLGTGFYGIAPKKSLSGQRKEGGEGPARFTDEDIPRANGLVLYGYAESDEVIKEYVAALKKAERTLTSGKRLWINKVIFNEASVNQVDESVLWDAPVKPQAGQRKNAPISGFELESMRIVYTFTIGVKFRQGYPQEAGAEQNSAETNAAS